MHKIINGAMEYKPSSAIDTEISPCTFSLDASHNYPDESGMLINYGSKGITGLRYSIKDDITSIMELIFDLEDAANDFRKAGKYGLAEKYHTLVNQHVSERMERLPPTPLWLFDRAITKFLKWNKESWLEALEIINQNLRRYPCDAYSYSLKADILKCLKRYDEALPAIRMAIDLGDNGYFTLILHGQILTGLKRYKESIAVSDSLIKRFPTRKEAYEEKCQVYRINNQWKETVECLTAQLKITPQEPYCLNDKAMALFKLGRLEESMNCIEESLAINPGIDYSWDTKARILEARGEHKEALVCCDKALILYPKKKVTIALKKKILKRHGRQ